MSGPVGADARGVTLFIAAGESAGRQDSGPLQPILVTSRFIAIWVVSWRLRVHHRRAEEQWVANRGW